MKILENSKLSLDSEELKTWPFWRYGWYGTDGCDWREYATDKGFEGIESIAEEASPLTLEQAENYGLLFVADRQEFLRDGAVRYQLRLNMPGTVQDMAEKAADRYSRDSMAITVGTCPKAYHSVQEIPWSLRKLRAHEAVLTLDAKDVPFRLHVSL